MAFSGSYAGIVIGMPMSGILTSWISWKAAFYFYGVMGLIWYCFWLWLSFEKPRYHPAISIQELKYIEKSLGDSVKLQMPTIATTPWHEICRSMPVYAIIVANFCRSWNFYLLVLYQSKYLKHSFNYEIAEVSYWLIRSSMSLYANHPQAGILGALPHLLMTIIVPFGGMLADHLRKNGIMSTTNVRKVFNCGGFGLEGLFFLFVAHATTGVSFLIVSKVIDWKIIVISTGRSCNGLNIWRRIQWVRHIRLQRESLRYCTEIREYSDGLVQWNRNNSGPAVPDSNRLLNKRSGKLRLYLSIVASTKRHSNKTSKRIWQFSIYENQIWWWWCFMAVWFSTMAESENPSLNLTFRSSQNLLHSPCFKQITFYVANTPPPPNSLLLFFNNLTSM